MGRTCLMGDVADKRLLLHESCRQVLRERQIAAPIITHVDDKPRTILKITENLRN